MKIIIVQKITNNNSSNNNINNCNNNNNNNLYKSFVWPLVLILHEKTSYCINQVAELLTFVQLINIVSFEQQYFNSQREKRKYTQYNLTTGCRQYLAHILGVKIIKKIQKTVQRLVICLRVGERRLLKWIIKKQEVGEGCRGG